jgi:NADH-quinone oxidoreductase subunit L
MGFIIIIGVLTNLFASITAIFQYDLKKIIAYSTASQLGLIFISFGIAKFNLAMFHIFTHAFFKALLFLVAGIIIHYAHNKQDLRSLKKLFSDNLTFIYVTFMYGTMTLAAIPFFSAYYSKDYILQASIVNVQLFDYVAHFFILASVVTTSIYSFKVCDFLF